MEIVELKIGGRAWTGWTTLSISWSLEQLARQFEMETVARQPGDVVPLDLVPGASCVVAVRRGGHATTTVTGQIDVVEISENKGAGTLSYRLAGTSRASLLVRCSHQHPTGEVRGLDAVEIMRVLARDYGIEVEFDARDRGGPLDKHTLEWGETVFEAMDRLARDRGWLLVDDAEGRVRIVEAGTSRGDNLVYGTSPVLSWSYRADTTDRLTRYVVMGQRRGTNSLYGSFAASNRGEAVDPWIDQDLPLYFSAEVSADPAYCQRRASWEAATRAGRATSVEVRLPGWRDSSGYLWDTNVLCHVVFPRAKVDRDLLVSRVVFSRETDGEFTTLTLSPPSGFAREPPATKAERKRSRPKASLYVEDWYGD